MKMGQYAALILGWILVNILGQVGLGCSQADACLILFWIFLACFARGASGPGVGCTDYGSCGC